MEDWLLCEVEAKMWLYGDRECRLLQIIQMGHLACHNTKLKLILNTKLKSIQYEVLILTEYPLSIWYNWLATTELKLIQQKILNKKLELINQLIIENGTPALPACHNKTNFNKQN